MPLKTSVKNTDLDLEILSNTFIILSKMPFPNLDDSVVLIPFSARFKVLYRTGIFLNIISIAQ